MIYRENLNKEGFKFYVSNIAVAILAKLGGIPWCLKDKSNDELIVGVGAFKSKQFNQRYLGSTFCFSSDGSFNGFLTAVFTGFEEKRNTLNINKRASCNNDLFINTKIIFTDMNKAMRVWNTIQSKNSTALKNIYFTFLSR